MKLKLTLLITVFSCCLFAQEQTFFIDFGPSSNTTISPDVNGNYWNNVTDAYAVNYPAKQVALVNSANVPSSLLVNVTADFTASGTTAPLTNPEAALLDDFAIATATGDYFYETGKIGEITISGLDPTHSYRFKMFASRYSNQTTRTTKYIFNGENEVEGTLTTTGLDIGANGYDGNNNTIYHSAAIAPSDTGVITFKVTDTEGNFGYIGIVEIEDYNVDLYPSTEVLENELFFDFGPNDGTNGNPTVGADANGNFWNNITDTSSSSTEVSLVNSENSSTGFGLQVTTTMTSNGILNGGLLAPEASKLGDFAIATATQDYFHTQTNGAFKISGLNQDNVYQFNMFGSRNSAAARVTEFEFIGLVDYQVSHQTTGSGIAENGYNGNDSHIATTELMYPDSNGEILVNVNLESGSFAHLNAMKVLEYSGVELVEMTALSISGSAITTTGDSSPLAAVITPENTTVKDLNWSVDDTSIAIIDANGILYPVADGTVTVTATSVKNPTISSTTTVEISNQINQLFVSGAQIENATLLSDALPMQMITDTTQVVGSKFRIFTSLNNSGNFSFSTSKDINTATVFAKGASENTIVQEGTPITSDVTGEVIIELDFDTNSYTITPIDEVALNSNLLPNGWDDEVLLSYDGDGIWSGMVDLQTATNEEEGFLFKINDAADLEIGQIENQYANLIFSDVANSYDISRTPIEINKGSYLVTLNLIDLTYQMSCNGITNNKISVMGSSVAYGFGATSSQGYIYQYSQLLDEMASNEGHNAWEFSNISIGGNDTEDLLARWDKDLGLDCSKYVIYGLSLGNEGILSGGQEKFDQFKDNMLALIQRAKDAGKTPVIAGNYANYWYNTEARYQYIKDMNLLIHQWDVASFNLLGALDNDAGQWPAAYQYDTAHPNHEGHTEMFYALVPSLFDALEAGKPQPQKYETTAFNLGTDVSTDIYEFTPEATVHSFTMALDFKTTQTGEVFKYLEDASKGAVYVSSVTGNITYTNAQNETIESSNINAADNAWHNVVLTHYYAEGFTRLYLDGVLQGTIDEQLEVNAVQINTAEVSSSVSYRNWMFYRSGMNQEEVTAIENDLMLKSSLELYAPLDGAQLLSSDALQNLAQSTNEIYKLTTLSHKTDVASSEFVFYPNPTTGTIHFPRLKSEEIYSCNIYSSLGELIYATQLRQGQILELEAFSRGIYLLELISNNDQTKEIKQLVIQ